MIVSGDDADARGQCPQKVILAGDDDDDDNDETMTMSTEGDTGRR